MTRTTAFVGIVFLALHLLSCSRFRSAGQCQALVRAVNDALDDVEATPGRNPPTVAAYTAISARYDRLAADLETLKFRSVMLSRTVDDYRKLCVTTARNAQLFAAALKTNEAFKLPAVRAAAAQTVRKEKMLVRRMDAICQP